MKQPTSWNYPALFASTVLTFTAACACIICFLNFQLGYPYLYDAADPFLRSNGASQPPGWNTSLLILSGPVLALFINLLAVLDLRLDPGKDRIRVRLAVTKSWGNLIIIFICSMTLLVLSGYLFLENCNCRYQQ